MTNIIKVLLIMLSYIILSSCTYGPLTIEDLTTENYELRQMFKTENVHNSSRGGFFLISGYYNSEQKTIASVKVMVNIDGIHRFIDIPFEKLGIIINNNIKTPVLRMQNKYNKEDLSQGIPPLYKFEQFIIELPEKYLPESFIPLNITE